MKWFKHDSNAHNDSKLKRIRQKYGMVGYGLYWYCIELIAGNVEKNNISFELEDDAEIIAIDWNLDQLKVEEMMRYFVQIGLFESKENTITCLKLAKRLDDTNSKNPQIRSIINSLKNPELVGETPKDSDSVGEDQKKSGQTRLDETRLDETKKTKAPYAKLSEELGVDVGLIERIVKHRRDIKKPANTDKKIKLVIGNFRECVEQGYFENLDQAMDKLDSEPWQTVKPDYLKSSTGGGSTRARAQVIEDFVNGNY